MDAKTLKDAATMDPSIVAKISSDGIPKFSFALRSGLTDKKFIPTRGTDRATGWDVRAAMKDGKELILRPGQKALIPLGIRGFCPEGWWYALLPRSSAFGKKSLHYLIGTIDEDYEGELLFACHYIPDVNCFAKDLTIEFGEALGQLIPERRNEVEMVEVTNKELDALFAIRKGSRGEGGFGSTVK